METPTRRFGRLGSTTIPIEIFLDRIVRSVTSPERFLQMNRNACAKVAHPRHETTDRRESLSGTTITSAEVRSYEIQMAGIDVGTHVGLAGWNAGCGAEPVRIYGLYRVDECATI